MITTRESSSKAQQLRQAARAVAINAKQKKMTERAQELADQLQVKKRAEELRSERLLAREAVVAAAQKQKEETAATVAQQKKKQANTGDDEHETAEMANSPVCHAVELTQHSNDVDGNAGGLSEIELLKQQLMEATTHVSKLTHHILVVSEEKLDLEKEVDSQRTTISDLQNKALFRRANIAKLKVSVQSLTQEIDGSNIRGDTIGEDRMDSDKDKDITPFIAYHW